jgi:undecaprenyl-diphosphatase
LQQVFGVRQPSMTFDIVVHIGSLCAVLAVFWKDILNLLKNPFQKMTAMLSVGTLPAVVVGYFFRAHLAIFHQAFFLAAAFIFTGVLLLIADNIKHTNKTEREMSIQDAIVIGCMQAVALTPGISRSGATITAALVCGLTRQTAARFSFLLSIIAIIAAGTLETWEIVQGNEGVYRGDIPAFMVGFVMAAVAGYFSIRLLLELIKKASLKYFAYYVFVLAAFILVDRFAVGLFFMR